jgi:hypothetical protein
MDSEEAVRAVEGLVGEAVEAIVCGLQAGDARPLATLNGILRSVPPPDPARFASIRAPAATRETLAEVAACATPQFTIGESMTTGFCSWSDRFLRAEPTEHPPEIKIVTRDGVIWICRYRPWLD